MDAFKIIQHECSKYQFCADCPFIDYEDPKRGKCLFMKSPEIWDTIKIWNILHEVGYISSACWTKDFICSACGCKCYPFDIDFGDYNYCPNCGRHMIEERR